MTMIVSQLLSNLLQATCEDGQGMAEYGLILALVAVVCAVAFTALQGGISTTINSVTSQL